MKTTLSLTSAAFVAATMVSSLRAVPIVSESFDYEIATTVVGQGAAADGWFGAWTGGGGSDQGLETVTEGLVFGDLVSTGGASQRSTRLGTQTMNRQISAAAQTALTADGVTMWFSVLMAPTGPGGDGFAANSFGTLVLGDASLTGASGSSAAPIAAGGNALGVSFASTALPAGDPGRALFENMKIQGVTYSGGVLTQEGVTDVGEGISLVVGSVDWAEVGTEDTLRLYLITDLSAPLPDPFVTMVVDLDQSNFNIVSIGDSQTSIFDELRFGLSLTDVLGDLPSSEELMIVDVSYDNISDPENVLMSVTFTSVVGKTYVAYGANSLNGPITSGIELNNSIDGEEGTTTYVIDFNELNLNKEAPKFFVGIAENVSTE